MADKLSEYARQILADVEILLPANGVRLRCGQLDRTLYEEVNAVLERLGGKWSRSKRVHLFPFDPTSLLKGVVAAGEMPPKNPLAFFPTPEAIVKEMIGYVPLFAWETYHILEPSAGTGAIANYLCECMDWRPEQTGDFLDLVEIDPFRANILRGLGYPNVYEQDFLTFQPGVLYDRIYMNPPFRVAGDNLAWITHVEYAWRLLKPGGDLAAIVPAAFEFSSQKRVAAFRQLVRSVGAWFDLPTDAFQDSGTGVNTCLLVLSKDDSPMSPVK